MENFKSLWLKKDYDKLLLNHKLLGENWVRMHTLDGTARYPESGEELEVVLQRYNESLTAITPANQQVVLLTSQWTNAPEPDGVVGSDYWRTILENPEEEDPEFKTYRHIFLTMHIWHEGIFNDLLTKIAKGAIAGTVIVPTDFAWTYFPYDGGADIVFSSKSACDHFRNTHKELVSSEQSGL